MFHNRAVLIVFVALGCLLAGTLTTPAQQSPTDDVVITALDSRAGRFLEAVSLGDTERAYADLLAGGRLAQQKEAVANLVEKTSQLRTLYGKYQSFERIATERVGQDLVLLTYLYKSVDFPVVWHFAFYRGTVATSEALPQSDGWRAVEVRFDTNLEALGQQRSVALAR